MNIQERRVSLYPRPYYHQLLIAYAKNNEQCKSKLPTRLIEDFFDNMGEDERARLRRLFRSMNAEERRRYFRKEGQGPL